MLATKFDDEALPPSRQGNGQHSLPFIEHSAGFLLYRHGDLGHNLAIQHLAILVLSNLTISHVDGTPLLSRSPSLIQRLIYRVAQDACILYDTSWAPLQCRDLATYVLLVRRTTACRWHPDDADGFDRLLQVIESSIRLLYHLVLSADGLNSLSSQLTERPVARDYFIAGIGRIACTEVPEWISDVDLSLQLDHLASETLCTFVYDGSSSQCLQTLASSSWKTFSRLMR